MLIKELQSFEELICAFDVIRPIFPDLIKRVNSINEYLKKIYDNALCIAALDSDNAVCAFAAMYNNDEKSKTAYITLIGVCPGFRNMNIGSKILDFLQNKALNQNMKLIKLEVNNNNFAAIRFYEKNGFVFAGRASDVSTYMIKKLS